MGRVKTAASAVPSPMPRQPYRSTLELDDLAPLFQRPTLSLRWFEILRSIKLNQSRHSNLFRTEHQISFTPARSLSVRFGSLGEVTAFMSRESAGWAGLHPVCCLCNDRRTTKCGSSARVLFSEQQTKVVKSHRVKDKLLHTISERKTHEFPFRDSPHLIKAERRNMIGVLCLLPPTYSHAGLRISFFGARMSR